MKNQLSPHLGVVGSYDPKIKFFYWPISHKESMAYQATTFFHFFGVLRSHDLKIDSLIKMADISKMERDSAISSRFMTPLGNAKSTVLRSTRHAR